MMTLNTDNIKKTLTDKRFYVFLLVCLVITFIKLRVDLGKWTLQCVQDPEMWVRYFIALLHCFVSIALLVLSAACSRIVAYVVIPYVLFIWVGHLYILFTFGYIEIDILYTSFLCSDWNELSHVIRWHDSVALAFFFAVVLTFSGMLRHYLFEVTRKYAGRIYIVTFLYIGITSALVPFLIKHSPYSLIPLVTKADYDKMTEEQEENFKANMMPQLLNPAHQAYLYRSLIPFYKPLAIPYYTWQFYDNGYLTKAETLPSESVFGEKDITVVLFIGESYRADHSPWNGYARQTHPRLSGRVANIVNFPFVASYDTSTVPSITGMLSGASCSEREIRYTSFLGLLKKHGFSVDLVLCRTTNWHHVPLVNAILDNKIDSAYMAESTDDMLSRIGSILQKPGKKVIIIEDGMGHYPYEHDAEFSTFGNEQIIDKYDNCLVQTDYVIDAVIKQLESRPSLLLYTSDHGQSFGEQGFFMHGASLGIVKQRHVFSFLWTSDAYSHKHADVLEQIVQNSQKYLTHSDIYFSFISLAGIECQTEQAQNNNFTKPMERETLTEFKISD